jgi:hypothetical protein
LIILVNPWLDRSNYKQRRETIKKETRDKQTGKSNSEEKNNSVNRQKVLFYEPKQTRNEEPESLFNVPASEEYNLKSAK